MRQRLLQRLLSKYNSLRLLQRLGLARQDPVAVHAIKVSDDAMAGETTPVIVVARTQVRVGTATTVVAIATTVIEALVVEALVVRVASEVKVALERKVAVTVVAMEAALASAPHVVAIVTDHAARVGRTRVVGLSKAPTDALIRVPGRIRLRVLMRAAVSTEAAVASRTAAASRVAASIRAPAVIRVAASIKAPAMISLCARINLPALNRAKARFETTLATAR